MRARLVLHVQADLSVTGIAYDLFDDQGDIQGIHAGPPDQPGCLPHRALDDLLDRLARANPQMTLFP